MRSQVTRNTLIWLLSCLPLTLGACSSGDSGPADLPDLLDSEVGTPDVSGDDALLDVPGDQWGKELPDGGNRDLPEVEPDLTDVMEDPDVLVDLAFEIPDVEEDLFPTDLDCAGQLPFTYFCSSGDPASCPGGMCVAGFCIGPVMDPNRWDNCGDEACEPCEKFTGTCPVDCGGLPVMTGTKEYNNDTTITVWVHGYSNSMKDWDKKTYGEVTSCSGILGDMKEFGINRPCGNTAQGALAPNQFLKVNYYGAIPADWLTPEQIAEIEAYPGQTGNSGLHRYALIVAKLLRLRLEMSGATHINVACHSMGCLITRYIIERNIENLAAERRFVRWYTSAGVIAGARLARLYDNVTVQELGSAFGIGQSDFIHMNPDFVQDEVCWWDHNLWEGNNPLLSGMIIHNMCATDPRIAEALNIALLDLNNPGDEPNDGIMYTNDEFFHSQPPGVAFQAADGSQAPASHSYFYIDHMSLPKTKAAGVLATANTFHNRRVRISLKELNVKKDRESHGLFDGEYGTPPADIIIESAVRYNPYIMQTYGQDILIHEQLLAHRSPEMFQQAEGTTKTWDEVIFQAPVFDQMTSLWLNFRLLEVDWYARFGIQEWIFDKDQELASFTGQVNLTNHTFEVNNQYVKATIEVRVIPMVAADGP
jgi:hypothetical protein